MVERFRRLQPSARLGFALAAAALLVGAAWFVWWTVSPRFRTVNGPIYSCGS